MANKSFAVSRARGMRAVASLSHQQWAISGLLAAIGSFALAVGMWVYIADRDPARSVLLPEIAVLHTGPRLGALGLWLPSFVHVLAFSLFSAALLAPTRRWAYGACAVWLAVNAAFEMGQHEQVRGPLADALRLGLGEGPVARALANYFLRGTFDTGDLVAAALGAALAASILHCLRLQRENHHAP